MSAVTQIASRPQASAVGLTAGEAPDAALSVFPYDVGPTIEQLSCELFRRSDMRRVLSHSWVRRLAHIRHYGALPWYLRTSRQDVLQTTRLNHSLAVASLCYASAVGTGESEVDSVAAAFAGLLHDIAHTPLSHSLEPLFRTWFLWDHNAQCASLAEQVLLDARVNARVAANAIQALTRRGRAGTALFGTAGIDAIENIHRGLLLLEGFSAAILSPAPWGANTRPFADIKQRLYRSVFYEPHYQLFERLVQASIEDTLGAVLRDKGDVSRPEAVVMSLTDASFEPHIANIAQDLREACERAEFSSVHRFPRHGGHTQSVLLRLPLKARTIRANAANGYSDSTVQEDYWVSLPLRGALLPSVPALQAVQVEVP